MNIPETKHFTAKDLKTNGEQVWKEITKSVDAVITDEANGLTAFVTGVGRDSRQILDFMALCLTRLDHPEAVNDEQYQKMTAIDSKIAYLRKSFEIAKIKPVTSNKNGIESFEAKDFGKAVWKAVKKGKLIEITDGNFTAAVVSCGKNDTEKAINAAREARLAIAMENLQNVLAAQGVKMTDEQVIEALKKLIKEAK